MIVDHSTAGPLIGGALRQRGFEGVIQYACGWRDNVNITSAQYHDLVRNGLKVGIVLEHEADWLIRAGVADRVRACLQVTRARGIPDGLIWLANDFDSTHWGPTSPGSPGDRTMYAVAYGVNQARSVWGNLGFYGSKPAIDWLIAHGYSWMKFWQTEAWSQGQRTAVASIFQRAAATYVGGVNCDLDDVWRPDWGQRNGAPPSHPQPVDPNLKWPLVKQGAKGHPVGAIQRLLGGIAVDGIFGPDTTQAVTAFQQRSGLVQDGIVGPATWTQLCPLLKTGSSGEAVTVLQGLLVYNFKYKLDVDAQYGPQTTAAVQAFQKSKRITPDGVVGPTTWSYLVS